ncbi:hypothetical protein BN948_01790 [Hydrogenophaga intermedia]|uniref:Uncharacterized protein n=1 Tax=Hydrogenophaga intermedia TaxID=65786 RepID=A0A1L1PBK1_HYDIT|nr:hypothetical protein [Hydrogenophaga intermedia]CDN87368.1 hypothetical protein BN948_01790 [Hydrogenophaga intermedia]
MELIREFDRARITGFGVQTADGHWQPASVVTINLNGETQEHRMPVVGPTFDDETRAAEEGLEAGIRYFETGKWGITPGA